MAVCAVSHDILTEYSSEFAQEGDTDNLFPLDSITRPTEKESEQHSAEPRRAGHGAALRQFESQGLGQIQHERVLVEKQ